MRNTWAAHGKCKAAAQRSIAPPAPPALAPPEQAISIIQSLVIGALLAVLYSSVPKNQTGIQDEIGVRWLGRLLIYDVYNSHNALPPLCPCSGNCLPSLLRSILTSYLFACSVGAAR